MLRAGHQNVYRLYNKVPNLCVFLSQSTPSYNIFGITESRLDSRISDLDINIPNYCISKKDSTVIGQTGIAVYIYNSIADITQASRPWKWPCWMHLAWAETKHERC